MNNCQRQCFYCETYKNKELRLQCESLKERKKLVRRSIYNAKKLNLKPRETVGD